MGGTSMDFPACHGPKKSISIDSIFQKEMIFPYFPSRCPRNFGGLPPSLPRLVGGMIGFDHPQIFTKHCLIGFLRKARPRDRRNLKPGKYKHNDACYTAICTECIHNVSLSLYTQTYIIYPYYSSTYHQLVISPKTPSFAHFSKPAWRILASWSPHLQRNQLSGNLATHFTPGRPGRFPEGAQRGDPAMAGPQWLYHGYINVYVYIYIYTYTYIHT